ncbi:MAG TPA: arginine--tRNA ligase [Candidatus Moranbacteria bacterium]|nr:arginine--tRNA ligase [Candidatus Moranbacteria bacterium]HRZ33958.1 arginine--tRNA ligase [Candidatus Moranbacteria bacterium]
MKKNIKRIIKDAILSMKEDQVYLDFNISDIIIDYPKNEKFGDYTSNICMILGKKNKKNPLEIAEQIKQKIIKNRIEHFDKIEIAVPGYINFHLSKKYLQEVVRKINSEKNNFGNSKDGNGVKVNNEFISANPTGPLHLGNGRGGFYGDSISRVLKKAGFEVINEYYVNDAGEQIEKLGHSVLKDGEATYVGEYIDELNKTYGNISNIREAGEKAADQILKKIKKTTSEKMHISFDIWMNEKEIQEKKYIERAIELLKDKNLTYESEGAVWLKTTEFGDEKDRVLIKSNGQKAYLAGDAGYMLNKIERGFKKIIIGLGADHHGYITRLRALAKTLGFIGDFRVIISQMVRLIKDGQEARMSKRAGNVVYIDDLIEEIGHDVTRFFFLLYSPDTHMNFDLSLAKERSQKNPVFYVQYAHARICSILNKSKIQDKADLSLLTHEKEIGLIKELNKFPELVEEISFSYEVHKLPHYAINLADRFHSFYDACRVIDEENYELTKSRLLLVNSVRIVLSEVLNLIGVSAPTKM